MNNKFKAVLTLLLLPMIAHAEPGKIGIVLPLTGKAAVAGEAVRNGVVMANADNDDAFELIFEDSALDNDRTISATKKLIETDKVDALIVFASGPSKSAAPIAEHAQIPMIGLAVDPEISRQRRWVMIHWAPNRAVAGMIFDECRRRNLKRLGMITAQTQSALDLEGAVQRNAITGGMAVPFQMQVSATETDFSAIIQKMKKSSPDGVFLNLYFGQAGNFARQAAAMDFKPQFFGSFVLDDDAEIASSQGALDNAFFVTTSAGDLSFDQEYVEKFGKRPVLGGIGAYDAVTLLAEAFEDGATRSKANTYLHSIQTFSGKIGRYRALADNSFNVPTSVGEIHDSKAVK